MQVIPYITFTDGQCAKALKFYKEVLNAKIEQEMKFEGSPMETPENKELILHTSFKIGTSQIMASDTTKSSDVTVGNNITMSLDLQSKAEVDRIFTALSKGGKVVMALNDTFWGAYFGILIDQFGIQWMFNFDEPQK